MNVSSKLSLGSRSRTAAGALFSVGLLAVMVTNPGVWLQSGFETAINDSASDGTVAQTQTAWTPPIAGSEAYWLGPHQPVEDNTLMHATTWQSPVVKGDRFSITSGNRQKEFEVIKLEPLSRAMGAQRADLPAAQPNQFPDQFVIICKSTDRDRPETLKFLVEAGGPLPWAAAPIGKAHAL